MPAPKDITGALVRLPEKAGREPAHPARSKPKAPKRPKRAKPPRPSSNERAFAFDPFPLTVGLLCLAALLAQLTLLLIFDLT